MKLRLYHHADGARIAYREQGTGPGLVLWHSELLTHRALEPLVEGLEHRFRVVLPDLPLHGDSEDRPKHPYTLDWLAEVVAGFCIDVAGPRPLVGGQGIGAEIVLRAIELDLLHPARLVLMPARLHKPVAGDGLWRRWRQAMRVGDTPGLDRLVMRGARVALRPDHAIKLSARRDPAAADLVQHAMADVGGNANLARSWARLARRWPTAPRRELLDLYPKLDMPVLLLWPEDEPGYPTAVPEELLDLIPRAQLRTVERCGYLMSIDDPVSVAREIAAFCG